MRLVPRTPLQAIMQRALIVVHEHVPIIRMRAVLDDHRRTLARAQAAQISETLFSDDHVQVVLCKSKSKSK